MFRFALTENTCFDALSVKKGEEMITCVVKEKEEAKEEYKEAVELGNWYISNLFYLDSY